MSAVRLQTRWPLLASPANHKPAWTTWKVKSGATFGSGFWYFWGETLRRCFFFPITLHLTLTGREPLRGFESQPVETFLTDGFSALLRPFTQPIHFHLTPRQRAAISLLSAQSPAAAPTVQPVYQTSRYSVSTPASQPIRDMLWCI